MLSRTTSMSAGLILLISLAALLVSCDEARHHEVMTFFFDGVDQAESQRLPEGLFEPNSPAFGQESEGPTWYVHEPSRDCTNCHDTKRQSRSSGRAYLVAPVPELCHDCHDNVMASPNVHGPVAVGQCLQCHNPHKTQVKYLLEGTIPELCYGCHDVGAIESIPAHFVTELAACADCHDPHASVERPLLKEDAHRLGAERAVGRPVQGVQKPPLGRQPAANPDEVDPELRGRKQEIANLYYSSMDLYRDGRLVQAREGLVTVVRSGLIPQAMGTMIRRYIADIDKRLVERTK